VTDSGSDAQVDPSCISETARIAPDGTTTRDFTNSLDQRWGLRLEIAGFGLVAARALLLLSARDLRRRDDLLQLDRGFALTV
jgi:hypothetical protein